MVIIHVFFCQQKKPDKVIGFTQSSCPAFHLLPSDEDYKTLPFVISLQRWDKGLEYASFEFGFHVFLVKSCIFAALNRKSLNRCCDRIKSNRNEKD